MVADKINDEFALIGRYAWNSELSTIDIALLISSMLHVQQYFDRDHIE